MAMLDAERAQQEAAFERQKDQSATEIGEALASGDDGRAEDLMGTYRRNYGDTPALEAFRSKLNERRSDAVRRALAKHGLTIHQLAVRLDLFEKECVAVLRSLPVIVYDEWSSARQAIESRCRISTESYSHLLVNEKMRQVFCLYVEHQRREWEVDAVDELKARYLACDLSRR